MIDEYSRIYRNFDRAMACIEDIVIIASKTNNMEIGKRVERLLKELESTSDNGLDETK